MTDTEAYAAAVVRLLAGHFPDLRDQATAVAVTDLIAHHARNPQAPFEVIVDNPISAKWRLHADPRDRARVLLYIHRTRIPDADADLSRTVNDTLRALEA